VQREDSAAAGNEEITVDVIGVDDHDKENDWNSQSKDISG